MSRNALRFRSAFVGFALMAQLLGGSEAVFGEHQWETVQAKGEPTARHEAALVAFRDRIYLIGGRRINPVDVFDPATATWTAMSETPIELHHFQAVTKGDAIYLVGAMTGAWPKETPLERTVAYYPERDEFKFLHPIPPDRRRGGAGAALYNGKIYIVGGITNGHMDGYQPWLDEYDPETGKWTALADAPHARDHFQAVVVGDRLYAAAGRRSSQRTQQGFELTVEAVDIYDFKLGRWLDEDVKLPTLRAGNMAFAWGSELIIGGGESGDQVPAHAEVEALEHDDANLARMAATATRPSTARDSPWWAITSIPHRAAAIGGGGPELTSVERLKLP